MRCARPCGSAAACDVACPDPELRECRRLAAGADAASVMTGAAERSLQVAVVLLYLVQLTAGTGTAGVLEGGGKQVRWLDQSATRHTFNFTCVKLSKLSTETEFLKTLTSQICCTKYLSLQGLHLRFKRSSSSSFIINNIIITGSSFVTHVCFVMLAIQLIK